MCAFYSIEDNKSPKPVNFRENSRVNQNLIIYNSVKSRRDLCVTMFKNTFQSGFLSILYSIGSKPLQIWDKKVLSGKSVNKRSS